MKKLLMCLCMGLVLVSAVSAQEKDETEKQQKASWPVWIAFNSTKNIDVAGLRLTIPYGECEDVTGFDIGLFGRCQYMAGLQLNILRNDVEDWMAGIQVGIYNSIGQGNMLGTQVGLWNESYSMTGLQVGLVNIVDYGNGFQVGIINRAEALDGFQLGVINVIRSSQLPFMPLINIGF